MSQFIFHLILFIYLTKSWYRFKPCVILSLPTKC